MSSSTAAGRSPGWSPTALATARSNSSSPMLAAACSRACAKIPNSRISPIRAPRCAVAASDGASRYARSTGHGYGIGQLFRALAHHTAGLRFRSGDHALRLWGDAPSLAGQVELAQKAWLDGLTITIRCTPGQARPRS